MIKTLQNGGYLAMWSGRDLEPRGGAAGRHSSFHLQVNSPFFEHEDLCQKWNNLPIFFTTFSRQLVEIKNHLEGSQNFPDYTI